MIHISGFTLPWWAIVLACDILAGTVAFICYVSRPVNASVRRRTEMSKVHHRQKCHTCHGEGVYDITNPSKHLVLADQMSNINQTSCVCCTGNGFHMLPIGQVWNCMRLVARRG